MITAAFSVLLLVMVILVPGTRDLAHAAVGDIGIEGPSHAGTGTPTGTKRSESIAWHNDGAWWANMWDTASRDFHMFRLNPDTRAWVDTGVATDTRANTHSDVLWSDGKLYVSSHAFVSDGQPAVSGSPSYLYRFSYLGGKYVLDPGFPSKINDYKTETLTIDKELTSGVLWATWQQNDRIYVARTTGTDNTSWMAPFELPGAAQVSVDDTSALIAFSGKIGVMWGSQGGSAPDGFYFSTHSDGADAMAWSKPMGASVGGKLGDDHINLKWLDASSGTVYAAVKTSLTAPSAPQIQLLKFSNGEWSTYTIAKVSECPNRVIVVIDKSAQRLRTFATYPKPAGTTNGGTCTSSGGAIYEKSTSLSDINFPADRGQPVMLAADSYLHNVTSTKRNVSSDTGLVLLADNNAAKKYWYYYEPPASEPPPADTEPPDTAIDAGPSGTVATTSATIDFSASEAGSRFECSLDFSDFVGCDSPFTTTGLSEGDHRFYVRAIDNSGNIDSTPATRNWIVDTSTAPPDQITGLGELGQATSTTSGKTLTLTVDRTVPAGSKVIIAMGYSGAPKIAIRASDSVGNDYSVDARKDNGTSTGTTSAILSATLSTKLVDGSQITMTLSGGTTYRIAAAYGYSGVADKDVSATATGKSRTPSSGLTSPTSARAELLFGVTVYNSGSASHTAGPDLTELTESHAGTKGLAVDERILGETGSYGDSGTLSASTTWTDSVVTYQ